MRKIIVSVIILTMLLCLAASLPSTASEGGGKKDKILYLGHASLRIVTAEGKVIYVDPFAGDAYDLSADLILVAGAESAGDDSAAADADHAADGHDDAVDRADDRDGGDLRIVAEHSDKIHIGDLITDHDENDQHGRNRHSRNTFPDIPAFV